MKEKQKRDKIFFDWITIFLFLLLIGLSFAFLFAIYQKEKNIKVFFSFVGAGDLQKNKTEIEKGDNILVYFNGPVNENFTKDSIIIEPKLDFSYNLISSHRLQIEIEENLKPKTDYRIWISNFKSKWGVINSGGTEVFSTVVPPELESFSPSEDLENIKINESLVFNFNKSFPDRYWLEVEIEPSLEFEKEALEKGRRLSFKPSSQFQYETEYRLKAKIIDKLDSEFEKDVLETSFKTEKVPVVVYGWNSNGVPYRTEKKTSTEQPKILNGKYIDIDLSEQNLYIFENGRELGAFKVSTGLRGMDTPAGNFNVISRAVRPWSEKYKLYMPWFIQFTNEGHGIHELPEWPGGYKEGASHLGIPVSHGCVRLGIGPAKKVYDFVETGTPIVIHY